MEILCFLSNNGSTLIRLHGMALAGTAPHTWVQSRLDLNASSEMVEPA